MIKANFIRVVAALMLMALVMVPAYGQQNETQGESGACAGPSAEAIIFDTLILRPVGLAAMVVGFAGAVVALPFAALSHSVDRVAQKLIVEPFEYTFMRPVGDTDYDYCE